jgi:hypothetical protein
MLGDGGISQYQVIVTLNAIDDKEYSVYVACLIKKLFGVDPSFYYRKTASAVHIVVSRIGLVDFLTRECGLIVGNKIMKNADIPEWIKENTEMHVSCIRGLVDTDGSVFTHKYLSKGKEYRYKKLSYTSVSVPLLYSAHALLKEQGLTPRFGSNSDLRLDSKSDMNRYFSIISSHNPKHLNRYAS